MSPRHDGIDDVVAVGEHVGHDLHRFADGRLGSEGAVVDDWSHGFDDDSARAVGWKAFGRAGHRSGHQVVGSSCWCVVLVSGSAVTVRAVGRAWAGWRLGAWVERSTTIDRSTTSSVSPGTLVDRSGRAALGVRCVEVDRPAPAPLRAGNLPLDRLIGGIEDHEKAVVDDAFTIGVGRRNCFAVQKNCDRTGESGVPIVVGHLLAVGTKPRQIFDAADRTPLEPAASSEHRMTVTECHDALTPFREIGVDLFPVEPRDLVVLAVGVVVATLSATEFVATEQHRNALREQQRRHQVATLTYPKRCDLRRRRSDLRRRGSTSGCATLRRCRPRRWPRCACRCTTRGRATGSRRARSRS